MRSFIRVLVSAFALWLTTLIVGGSGNHGVWIKPINADEYGHLVTLLLVAVVAWLSDLAGFGLKIDSFWWGVLAAFVLSILSGIMNSLLGTNRRRERDR